MRWGAFAVRVSDDGREFTLLHGADAWASFTLHGLQPTGRFTDDDDEVEHGFTIPGASVAVRHAVGEAWTMRWALSAAEGSGEPDGPAASDRESEPAAVGVDAEGDEGGEGTAEVPGPAAAGATASALAGLLTSLNGLDVVPELRVIPGPGRVVWAWAAGAEAMIAVAPGRRAAPVVGLRLTQGWLQEGPGGFAMAPAGLELTAGRRWVGQLRAQLYRGVDDLAARLPAWLAPLELSAGQPWEFRDPDHALVVEPPATTRAEGDVIQVIGEAGRACVALHSPRGLTELTVSFAPSLDTLLAAGAAHVLRLPGRIPPAGAFVLAEALARSLISEPVAAERLLDDFDWSHDSDLLAIATGVARAQRNGNSRMLRAALRRLQLVHPQPGYGRVVMAAWLASLALGEDARDEALALLSRPTGSEWVALELNVLNLRSLEVAGGLFHGLVNALGGDLPGDPVGLDAVRQAQLVGLLQLCPEEWPMATAAAACAGKNSRRLLAGVAESAFADPDDLAVLAWLALGHSLL